VCGPSDHEAGLVSVRQRRYGREHGHRCPDASTVIDAGNDGSIAIYTGCEVDKQGTKGRSFFRKIDGKTGALLWEQSFRCYTILGEHPVNGGLLATPVLGKKKSSNLVVLSLARFESINGGLVVALDRKTGTWTGRPARKFGASL